MSNPVADFLKHAKDVKVRAHLRKQDGKLTVVDSHSRKTDDELEERARVDRELWQKWKDGGQKPEDLRPLMKRFRPMILKKAAVYSGKVRIPTSAVEATFKIEFANALKSYDPEKGKLGTYVYRYLDKGKRWITENQNVGRIPENRVYKIRKFQKAIEEFQEENGRVPTDKELSHQLGWSTAEVDRMNSELRSDVVSQLFEEDPYAFSPSRTEEVLKLFKYELQGEQREVYEYLTGNGRPHISSTGEIAKKMGIPDYQVSRIKKQIESKLRRYLKS